MRLTRAVALFLIFLVAVSIAGMILKQKSTALPGRGSQSYSLLTVPTSIHHLSFLLTQHRSSYIAEPPKSVLNNITRTEILSYVEGNPGVQFRGICNELGLSVGLAQFHLGVLKKAGLVSFIRDGKYKRFFESKRFTKKQMKIISVLRHKTAGCILRVVLRRTKVSHSELASALSITSQGLTWQLNRLKENKLIAERKENKKRVYHIEYANAPVLTEMAKLVH